MPYSFEYLSAETADMKTLSVENHDFLAGYISKKWDEWDNVRSANLHAISEIEKSIYPSCKSVNSKMAINMPEIYEIRETYKAHLWKSWFSSLDSMFDVQGKTREDQGNSIRQKAALIDAFRSIDLVCNFEKGLDNWINKGEFIAFVSWSTKIKKTRRKQILSENHSITGDESLPTGGYSLFEKIAQERDGINNASGKHTDIGTASESFDEEKFALQRCKDKSLSKNSKKLSQFTVKDEIIYDGPDITIVAPEAFVFDPAKKENFETCPKVYRSWATYDEIQANLLYKNIEGLDEIISEKASHETNNKAFKNDQIEILEFWGDIKLSDGTVLKNYVVTLAGRKNIIRFEENPFILNPFIYAAFLEDPETKRGYSPLYIALPLNDASQIIMNLQLDALKLIINKPYLAPKGALSGKINIKEGAIIEYDPALMPKEPVALDFKDALVGWDFLKYFESKIESTTGMFKYMTGNPSGINQRTATEASGLMTGQNIRLSKEIDFLNYRVKMPIIRKIAELMANFSFDVKEIKIPLQNGDIDFVIIDETVRQGAYEYLIGDSNAAFERKMKLKETLDFLYQFAKNTEVAPYIKWLDVMKWAFGQIGSVDPNMFIKDSKEA